MSSLSTPKDCARAVKPAMSSCKDISWLFSRDDSPWTLKNENENILIHIARRPNFQVVSWSLSVYPERSCRITKLHIQVNAVTSELVHELLHQNHRIAVSRIWFWIRSFGHLELSSMRPPDSIDWMIRLEKNGSRVGKHDSGRLWGESVWEQLPGWSHHKHRDRILPTTCARTIRAMKPLRFIFNLFNSSGSDLPHPYRHIPPAYMHISTSIVHASNRQCYGTLWVCTRFFNPSSPIPTSIWPVYIIYVNYYMLQNVKKTSLCVKRFLLLKNACGKVLPSSLQFYLVLP